MNPITDVSHLDILLDRQMKSSELRRRLAEAGGGEAGGALTHRAQGPWITVSKQRGAGGLDLAREVGRRLGWEVFDREILEAISRETHWRLQVVSRLDEEATGPWSEWISHLVVPGEPARAAFAMEMLQVIHGIARRGCAVLVGRGANWILDPTYGLRIRVIAPLEKRIEAVTRHAGLDRGRAIEAIRSDEEASAAFLRRFHRKDIDDPDGYDLIVNLGSLPLPAAAEAVLVALRRKLGGA
jgi:cytidylate kinase